MGRVVIGPEPLVRLGEALGITRDQLVAIERPREIHHLFKDVTVKNLDVALIQEAINTYGRAFSLEFHTGDLVDIHVTNGTNADELQEFIDQANGAHDVVIRLAKETILDDLGITGVTNKRLYLFTDALAATVARGPGAFEDEVWEDASQPLDIWLCDTATSLVGPWLRLFGPIGTVPPVRDETPDAGQHEHLLAQRSKHIGWEGQWVRKLTPFHLRVDGSTDHAALLHSLQTNAVALAAMYTCDRARQPGNSEVILAEFRGGPHIALVALDRSKPVRISPHEIHAALDLVAWAYAHDPSLGTDWAIDRLPFVQTRVAQLIEPRAEEERFQALISSAPHLLKGLEWEWKAFIEGRISSYLLDRRDLEKAVGDAVITFRERTSDLVKALSEAVLAAVALLIGTFIASALDEPFNETLFRIGMLAYGAYVVLFPGLLGITATAVRFRSALSDFDTRLDSFKRTLGDEVEIVVGRRIRESARDFWIATLIVSAVYAGLAYASWVASTKIPAIVRLQDETGDPPHSRDRQREPMSQGRPP